jgi:arylformamidase
VARGNSCTAAVLKPVMKALVAVGMCAIGVFAFPAETGAAGVPTDADVSYDLDSPPPNPAENQLDVWVPAGGGSDLPVAVFAHGGAWLRGDKDNRTIPDKARLFNDAGYVFVSVNYRLSPDPPQTSNPGRVKFPDHPHDVGEAVAWVRRNIAAYGGDPRRIVLLGHSSGAHLVSLVGTDPAYLEAYGHKRKPILGVVSLDTAAFDLRGLGSPATSPIDTALGWNAFGTPSENAATSSWAAGSPVVHADRKDPPFLFVTRGSARRQQDNRAMAQALGQDPDGVVVLPLTHEEINGALGNPTDTSGETETVMAFVNAITRIPGARIRRHPDRATPAKGNRVKVRFRFKSDIEAASFECRLDNRSYRRCNSPKSYRVKRGRHRFRVRALNGALKGEPESFRFRVR